MDLSEYIPRSLGLICSVTNLFWLYLYIQQKSADMHQKIKAAGIDLGEHSKIIGKYITARSLLLSYSVSTNEASVFIQITTLGQVAGTQNLDLDHKLYLRLKIATRKIVESRLRDIFRVGKKCMAMYLSYMSELKSKTLATMRAMDKMHKEVQKHNDLEIKTISTWGKIWSTIKYASDVSVGVLSNLTGPAGTGIDMLYTYANLIVVSATEADQADVWILRDSVMKPHLIAFDKVAETTFKGSGRMLKDTGLVVGLLMSSYDYHDNMKKFD